LQDNLDAMENAIQLNDYAKAADDLQKVKVILAQKVIDQEDQIAIMTTIEQEASIQSERLISELFVKWKELIVWSVTPEKDQAGQKVELRLNTKGDNEGLMEKVVTGLKKVNRLDDRLRRFAESLYVHMIHPVVMRSKGTFSSEENAAGSVFMLEIAAEEEEDLAVRRPQQVVSLIEKLLGFLKHYLLHIKPSPDSGDDLMLLLGDFVASKTLELVVKECFIKAIPSSNKDLEQLNGIISITNKFHKQLLELKFISHDNTILPDFVQNVNTLFANKKCQELLEKARKLMTTEVHNTVKVTQEKPLGELPPLVEGAGGKKQKTDELASEVPLSVNTFRLPPCHIR